MAWWGAAPICCWSTAQLTQCFEQRVVGFLASISLDTLSAGDPNADDVSDNLALELVKKRGFSDSGLAGDEDDLSLPA